MATTDTTKQTDTPGDRKRQARPHIAELGKKLAAEDRETLDLLAAFDRDEPEAVRALSSPTK